MDNFDSIDESEIQTDHSANLTVDQVRKLRVWTRLYVLCMY